MFISKPAMGVRGIFPLIKKHAAECITVLPGFDALPRGTRLAIDATLWTQRLHFAGAGNDQHPNRHVFGFYRLIKQLREHDLVPIMVFDNVGEQARLPAKSREHERRRSIRCLLMLRAKIEEQRAKRLHVLQEILEQYRRVSADDQAHISRLLSGWRDKDAAQQDQEGLMNLSHDDESAWDEALSPEEAHRVVLDTYAELQRALEVQDHELDLLSRSADGTEDDGSLPTIESSNELHEQTYFMETKSSSSSSDAKTFGYAQGAWNDAMWSQVAEAEESSVVRLAARIRALRRQYALHVARADAGAAVSYGVSAEWPKETATQRKMTDIEGEVFRALEAGVASPQLSTPEPTEEEKKQAQQDEANAVAAEAAEAALEDRADEEENVLAAGIVGDPSGSKGLLSQDMADETSVLNKQALEEEKANLLEALMRKQADEEPSTVVSLKRTEETTPTEPRPVQVEPVDARALDDIETLTERNAHMQQYYVRSSTTLTQSAYESCATLCEMLNVPVLWTGSGSKGQGRPHEAEAMASMLVRHGYADMVVSEDSDVLLYDAPLLRGAMGSRDLELVDSISVRRTLFPPSEASKVLRHLPHARKQDENGVVASDDDGEELDQEGLFSDDADADVEKEFEGPAPSITTVESESEAIKEDLADRLSRRQMLDFALLCGTDFNRTIPGIAAFRALRLIQEFGSIDGIRAEAARRAALDKRKAKQENLQRAFANTGVSANNRNTLRRPATKMKVGVPPSDPSGSSLIPSLRNESGLRTPDTLTWREYGKELTQARHVFEHPPTLYRQLRKVRDLKRGKEESVKAASLAAATVDGKAVRAFLRERASKSADNDDHALGQGRGQDGSYISPRRRRRSSTSAGDTPVDGFGERPYDDGGPIALWP